jgi:hypothetical protein
VIERTLAMTALLAVSACGYAPARFTPAPPVHAVSDDRPIDLPAVRLGLDELYHAEAYLDASLVDGLELSLAPRAEDVNRLDEVVQSSWFRGGRVALDGYLRDGLPVAPWLPVSDPRGLVVPDGQLLNDARGLRYQLFFAAPDRIGAITTALPVASRLAHALGYRVAEAHVVDTPGGQRAVALRWPTGLDLGPTPMLWTRPDDPNDEVSHVARRSLRASWVLAAWLGIRRFDEATFRDVYVGAPGRGHVEHWIVGLSGALGVGQLLSNLEDALDPSRDDVGFFGRLGTLGLTPLPPAPPTTPTMRGVGILPPAVAEDFDLSPPFAPHRRMRPEDAYWLARRMMAIDDETLVAAVGAAGLSRDQAARLVEILRTRRDAVARQIFARVTPVELVRLVGRRLTLRDVEVAAGIGAIGTYRATVIDSDGQALVGRLGVAVDGAKLTIALPARLADYEIVRLWRLDGERSRPRAFEIHLGRDPEPSLRGLRH